MIMELENLNIHCRNCKEHERRPKGLYSSLLASIPIDDISPNIADYLSNVRRAKATLGECRPIFSITRT